MSANAIEQDLIRKRLRPAEYIMRIEEALEELRTHWQTLTRNQIDALKAGIDGNGKLLAKCLPDLRAIEVTPERESPVRFIFADGAVDSEELKERLNA